MFYELFDALLAKISRKWLIGRRFVMDLSEADERRVAVIELPQGSFSFDLRQEGEKFLLNLVSGGSVSLVATFSDEESAMRAAKKVRWAMVRPFKRAFLACVGIFFVMLTFDLLSAPRVARVGVPQPRASLTFDPSMAARGVVPAAPAAQPQPAPALAPSAGAEAQNSPEVEAALRLLKK